jgi:hypothetical protein
MANKYPYVKIISKTEPSFDFLLSSKSEDIKVFYLEAPLSAAKQFNTMFTQVHLYHTGLGFECGDIRFEIEFTANYPMIDAVIPTINEDGTLNWTNDTSVRLGQLSMDYWIINTYLCTITKQQFIKFRDDILSYYIPNNNFYVLARGSLNTSTYYLDNPYLRSSTCDDFVIYGLNFFKNLGVVIEYVTYPKFTIGNIVGGITKIDYDTNKNEILDFYKNLVAFTDNYIEYIDVEINMELLLAFISKFYSGFNKIIYYAYDVNDGSKMSYYRVKLSDPPMIAYTKTLVNNTYNYPTLEEMLKNSNAIPINPGTNTSSSNFLNNSSNKTKYIFFGLLIVFVICILIFYNRKKIFKNNNGVY